MWNDYVILQAKGTFTFPDLKEPLSKTEQKEESKYRDLRSKNYEKLNEALGVPAWFRK